MARTHAIPPRGTSWVFALLSATLGVGFIGAAQLTGEYVHVVHAMERVKGNDAEPFGVLMGVLSDEVSRLQALSRRSAMGVLTSVDPDFGAALEGLGRIESIGNEVLEGGSPDLITELRVYEDSRRFTSAQGKFDGFAGTVRKLRETAEEISKTDKERARVATERSATIARYARLARRYDLISTDLGELLSLTPLTMTDPWAESFYREGILQGLPILRNLPDGIEDLHQLRSALDAARGSVTLEGANAHLLFQERLESLQTASQGLHRELAETDEFERTRLEQLKQRGAEREALLAQSEDLVRVLVVAQAHDVTRLDRALDYLEAIITFVSKQKFDE